MTYNTVTSQWEHIGQTAAITNNTVFNLDATAKNNIPYIIEVNTTPGMSKESIIPKMVKSQNDLELSQLLDWTIQEAIISN